MASRRGVSLAFSLKTGVTLCCLTFAVLASKLQSKVLKSLFPIYQCFFEKMLVLADDLVQQYIQREKFFNSVVHTQLVLNFFISMRITYLCKLNRQIVVFAFEKEVVISFVWSVVLVRQMIRIISVEKSFSCQVKNVSLFFCGQLN